MTQEPITMIDWVSIRVLNWVSASDFESNVKSLVESSVEYRIGCMVGSQVECRVGSINEIGYTFMCRHWVIYQMPGSSLESKGWDSIRSIVRVEYRCQGQVLSWDLRLGHNSSINQGSSSIQVSGPRSGFLDFRLDLNERSWIHPWYPIWDPP